MNLKNVKLAALLLMLSFGVVSVAQANYRGWNGRLVERLAHDLQRKTTHVHRQAERETHHRNYAEQTALRLFHELENAARHFHHQIERSYQNPRHSRRDFRQLRRVFNRAAQANYSAHFTWHVMNDFYEAERLMNELEYAYSYSNDRWNDHRGGYNRGGGHHRGGGRHRGGWHFRGYNSDSFGEAVVGAVARGIFRELNH